MHTELRLFLSQLIGVVAFTLIPVVFTAFVSLPMNMNRHPGDPLPHQSALYPHTT